jgi:hypothetical protein
VIRVPRKAAAVVLDYETDLLFIGFEDYTNLCCVCVLDHIVDGLLQDTVQRSFNRGRQPSVVQHELEIELQLAAFAPLLHQLLDRRLKSEIVEARWPNLPSQPVDPRHSIRVEWVNSGRGQFNRLIDRLSQSSALIPSIVMLDFQTLGGAIWQLIARCSTMLPHLTIGWLIVNHHGSCPPFNEALWQNVTVFGARPTLN